MGPFNFVMDPPHNLQGFFVEAKVLKTKGKASISQILQLKSYREAFVALLESTPSFGDVALLVGSFVCGAGWQADLLVKQGLLARTALPLYVMRVRPTFAPVGVQRLSLPQARPIRHLLTDDRFGVLALHVLLRVERPESDLASQDLALQELSDLGVRDLAIEGASPGVKNGARAHLVLPVPLDLWCDVRQSDLAFTKSHEEAW